MPTGLVLEGGAMRGTYTAGALKAFEDNGVKFKYITGVSMGAITAMNYISGQCERNRIMLVDKIHNPNYFGFRYIKTAGSAFNFDYILGSLMKQAPEFDFDAFFSADVDFRITTTDISTGKPVFFTRDDLRTDERLRAVRASASLPHFSRPVELGGHKLLDGGMSCLVPIKESIADGNEYNVIIWTKHRAYVRKPLSMSYFEKKFKAYPEFLNALRIRHKVDAAQREYCLELERQGRAVLICADEPLPMHAICINKKKLSAAYELGYHDATKKLDAVRNMIALGEKTAQLERNEQCL